MPDTTVYLPKTESLPEPEKQSIFGPLTFSAKVAVGTTFLFIATILVIGTLSIRSFKADLNQILLAQQNVLLEKIATNLDQKLLTMQRGLTLSAKRVSAEDISSGDNAQRYLDNNTGLQALFDRSIFLFSPTGKIIAEHPFLAERRGQDFSWRDYIKDTKTTQAPVISAPFVTTKTDHNVVLMLTAPVFSTDGRLIAILSGSLGLTRPSMLGDIAKTTIGKSGFLYLATKDGNLILHPEKSRLLQRAFTQDKNPLFEKALSGGEVAGETVDSSGKKYLTSYRHVSSTGWVIAAAYPMNEAFMPFNTLARRFIEMLLLACAIAAATALYYNRSLATKLQRTNRTLEKMREEVAHELKTRSRFFQGVSHDFKQRLHAVQLLLDAAEKSASAEIPPLLAKISHSVTDLCCYVKHFLDFARLETVETTPALRQVHLQDLFQKLAVEFEDVAMKKGVDLRMRATTLQLRTVEEMLLRILENLISNAIKFSRTRVLVGARRSGSSISIEVRDNGPGIPHSEREAIFEAFYQSRSYVDQQQEGIGLGLAIVRQLAKRMGYSVSVNAQEGRGSLVRVCIPLEVRMGEVESSPDLNLDCCPHRSDL